MSFPYQCAHELHKLFYAIKIFKSQKLPKYSIVVGNLSFGGSGKTPFTIRLAEELISRGLKPCVLMRGYKSQKKSAPLILDTSSSDSINVEACGDEALEIYDHFQDSQKKLIIAIHPNRLKAAHQAISTYPDIDIFILDDGFQHLAIEPNLRILLQNINENGYLREFAFNSKSADFIIYTKVDKDWLDENPQKLAIEFNLSLTKTLHNTNRIGIFTGIGDPRSFQSMVESYLKNQKFNLENIEIESWFFPDHHFFSENEVTQVLTLGINVITTRKDLTKIPSEFQDKFNLAQLELIPHPSNLFENIIQSCYQN
jgi:tetraacyldisaccharide 4'-kinase